MRPLRHFSGRLFSQARINQLFAANGSSRSGFYQRNRPFSFFQDRGQSNFGCQLLSKFRMMCTSSSGIVDVEGNRAALHITERCAKVVESVDSRNPTLLAEQKFYLHPDISHLRMVFTLSDDRAVVMCLIYFCIAANIEGSTKWFPARPSRWRRLLRLSVQVWAWYETRRWWRHIWKVCTIFFSFPLNIL
jgi:hypothetical protein